MKMGFKRGSAAGAAVLEVPEEDAAATHEWHARGPAPAGALQRGYSHEREDEQSFPGRTDDPEESYVPRRGSFTFRWRGLWRSVGGRILLGSVLVITLAVLITGFVAVRYFLLHNDHFVVTTSSDIQISGNQHLTRTQVLSVFGADLERNIFKVPLAERRTDLERLPWVQHATVMRLLPNKLRISITERVPVAFVRQGAQIGLVDAAGVLLDMPPNDAGDPHYSFPVLTGISASDPISTRAARMEIYQKFMQALDGSGEHFTQSLSEVDVTNPEDVKAIIASGGLDILVHFGEEDYLTRYKAFEQHLPEWKQQYPKLASADMRYPDQVVLEMQHGAETPLAGDTSASGASLADAGKAPAPAAKQPTAKTAAKPVAKKVAKIVKPAKKPAGGAR